ncbi:MAG: CHAT domain-containing protein [Calothrix sp. MO_192.B10]|nr:CHAT domain-containing protein [Calothrix sp. MO_192.B10]
MINKYRIWVHRRLLLFILCLLLGLVSTLLIAAGGIFPVTVQATSPPSIRQVIYDTAQSEQQGREYYEAGQFSTAIKIWQQVLKVYQSQGDKLNQARVLSNLSLGYQQLGQWSEGTQTITDSLKLVQQKQGKYSPEQLKVLAQALNTQGSLQLATGKSQAALATWQQAADTYKQAKNEIGVIRSLINKSQGLRSLGLYSSSLSTLTQVEQILQKQPDSALKAAGLRSLGVNLRLVRKLEQAQQVLQSSLAIAQKVSSPWEISSTLIDLGNVARAQQNTQSAVELYQQAASIAPSQQLKIHAQLNQLSTLIDTQQWKQAQSLRSEIQSQLAKLPPNRKAIYAQLNFAESLRSLYRAKVPDSPTITTIAQLIATSEKQAQALGDKQAQAYALGKLGGLYEQTQQWDSAQKLTQKALMLAQGMNVPEMTYRWQWQLGRIFTAQGNNHLAAIAAYNQAVKTLQSLRSDLVTVDSDVQFSFRESVEPVYRELVSLLLQPTTSQLSQKSVKSEPSQKYLIRARQVIESLQLAELDDFFHDACLDTKTVQIDKFDTQAAVIYPIILADRLEIILSLPHQPLRHYSTPIPQKQLETHVEKLRKTLVIRSRYSFKPLSKQLYNWLIRPAEKDLANSGVKTLVFVLDGVLRNIPMAVLHDGNQYLLEKYSIGLTPGLQLLPPQQLQQRKIQVLGAGLTKARQGFSSLEYVNQEFQAIKSKVPSLVLLNQEFTRENIEKNLQSKFFPIVHIATHGKFSSKALETFILTWDNRIRIQDLDHLLQISKQKSQQAIEMLVLSACETASGDKRAALGLAGIAVKAGAHSTLATLWPVNDEATAKVMSRFYQELNNTKQSKVEALRNSQLAMLRDPAYKHPLYWAPYILVGNWL